MLNDVQDSRHCCLTETWESSLQVQDVHIQLAQRLHVELAVVVPVECVPYFPGIFSGESCMFAEQQAAHRQTDLLSRGGIGSPVC